MSKQDPTGGSSMAMIGGIVALAASGALYALHEIGKQSRKGADAVSRGVGFFQPKENARKTTANNALQNIAAGGEVVASAAKTVAKEGAEIARDTAEDVSTAIRPK